MIVLTKGGFMNTYDICKEIDKVGGSSYYVGGYVRNKLIEKLHHEQYDNKDLDIEIHNIEPVSFESILRRNSVTYDKVGKSFGVYKVNTSEGTVDFSFPRTEKCVGNNHTAFDVTINPYLGLRESIKRRDITINGIMKNVLTGLYIDPFGGINDIKKKIIRVIDEETFQDDPLRVLRVCNFASRFGFDIEENTLMLIRKMDLSNLQKERIFEEYLKAFVNGNIIEFHKMLMSLTQFGKKYYNPEREIFKKETTFEQTLSNLMNPIFIEDYIVSEKRKNVLIRFYYNLSNTKPKHILWKIYKTRHLIPDLVEHLKKTGFDKNIVDYFERAMSLIPNGNQLKELGIERKMIKETQEGLLKVLFRKFKKII